MNDSNENVAVQIQPEPINAIEDLRKKYLKHEASVKSIGTLYCLGSFILMAFAIASIFTDKGVIEKVLLVQFFGGVGVLQYFVGKGLKRLRGWAKIVSIVLSCIGLLSIPIGTIINGYILYLLLSSKGKMVFSHEYQQVIEATPNIKYKTSLLVLIILALIILGLIGLIAAFCVSSK